MKIVYKIILFSIGFIVLVSAIFLSLILAIVLNTLQAFILLVNAPLTVIDQIDIKKDKVNAPL